MEIRITKEKHFPIVGIVSTLSLTVLIAGFLLFGEMGKIVLTATAVLIAIIVVLTIKKKPPCYRWESFVFVVMIAFLILGFAAAFSQGKGDEWARAH